MTKTLTYTAATTIFLVAATLLVYGGIRAYAASSLFGGATLGLGHVILVSDLSDGSAANDFSGVTFDDAHGVPFPSLAVLSADFDVTDDSCGGGSPRFQIQIDTDGDTVSDGNIFVYMGPSPGFSGCVGGSFESTGNLIGNEDAGRWDYTQLGGPLGGYSGAPANVLSGTVLNISIVVDSGWSAAASGGDSEMTTLIDNVTIAKLMSTTYEFNPPPDVTVTIVKYIDGAHATDTSAGGLSFPMESSWDADNIGAGSGTYSLVSPTYEAETTAMSNGADYSTNEVLTDPNVGASCSEGKPYALVGYSVGTSEVDAAGNTVSTTTPALVDITEDQYIIVWNETCETTGTLTLEKVVQLDDDGTAVDTDWTLSASGPTPISGVEGDASITNAVVDSGTYDLSESGPSGYDASAWNCVGGNQTDDDTVEIAAGDNVICTITNDDQTVIPPPLATACDTPGTAPGGYTLVNGTPGSDNVTIVPLTMFVGLGGNDRVTGLAAGDYIVCTEGGHDWIRLGVGESVVSAGDGSNRIELGDGNKTVIAGDGSDRITTGNGNDVIHAGTGYNTISSGAGDDEITAGALNDTIDGGAGFDTCDGGGNFDRILNCEA